MATKQTQTINWRGKRILICQPVMHFYTGSAIIALELAEFWLSRGAKVEMYVYSWSQLMAAECKRIGVKVHVAREPHELHLADFDYIWSHSETLPLPIIEELPKLKALSASGAKIPYFIYTHLSALARTADEWPWNYQLENKTADLVLYVSDKTARKQHGTINAKVPTAFFRNPAPTTFVRETVPPKRKLKSVLVVSNHITPELFEAKRLLKERGLRVDHLGRGEGDEHRLVTPRDIHSHDVVVTIGKTVQYALVAQTPVYIYDHWGGFGYLTPENYAMAKGRNFSGRGGRCKSGAEIANELMDGFAGALTAQNQAVQEDLWEFRLDTALERLLAGLAHQPKGNFPEQQVKALVAARQLCERRFIFWEIADEWCARYGQVEAQLREQEAKYERVRGVKGAARNLARAGRDYLRKVGKRSSNSSKS